MSKYKKYNLTEICDFQGGSQPPKDEWISEFKTGYIRMLQIRDFTQREKVKNEYIKLNKSTKLCQTDDILIARYGASLGKILTGLSGAYNVAIIKTIPDTNKLLKSYLRYFLISHAFQNYILNVASRAAQAGFNKSDLANLQIPLPSLEEQHKIASILDTVSEALKLRKQQLNELDLLVKSKFVEMFGDPVVNSKKLPTTELINIVKLQRGYDLPTQSRNSQGNIPVYGSNGILDYHNEAKTINGIITGRSGTIGKVYYCFDKYWPLNTTLFSIDTYGNNILYLSLLLQYFKLERFYSGTGVPTLNRNIIHKEQIIVVSIKEQNKFASFVQHVDKLKSEVQKSIDQLQTLFDSLMQQYFE